MIPTLRRVRLRGEKLVSHVRMRVFGRPATLPGEIRILRELLPSMAKRRKRPLRVFEWGMGNSTIHFARLLSRHGLPFDWHAVNNSSGSTNSFPRESRAWA